MPESHYRVRIVQAGRELEVEGDKDFVLEMLKRFDRPAQTVATEPPPGEQPADSQSGKALSVREFIRRFSFKKHTDIVVAFAYYLEHYSGQTEFTAADVNSCYYEAKMENSNTSQMLISNIKRGYVMESKAKEKSGRKRYTLTNTGEKYVEDALSTAPPA